MTDGRENQEFAEKPQEGRDTSPEVKKEIERMEQAASQPEVLIQAERVVQQSEDIEKQLVEALEAVIDGRPETEDRGGQMTSEGEISATPINTPGQNSEVELIPENDLVELIPENDRIRGESAVNRAAVSPSPEVEDDPPPPPDLRMGEMTLVEVELSDNAEEGEIPVAELIPDTEKLSREVSEKSPADSRVPSSADELELDGKGENPIVGSRGLTSPDEFELDGKGEIPSSSLPNTEGEVDTDSAPMSSPVETGDSEIEPPAAQEIIEDQPAEVEESSEGTPADDGEEGDSIFIGGEPAELEQIDLQSEAAKDVKEYWEPPEMYIYTAPDGSIEFVDARGRPIKSPPNLVQQSENAKGTPYKAWYTGSDANDTFEVPEYTPQLKDIYLYYEQDGSVTLVNFEGEPIPSPPKIMVEGLSKPHIKGPGNTVIEIPEFETRTVGVYAYHNQDGTVSLVTGKGVLLPSPPHYDVDQITGKVFAKTPWGETWEISIYSPPLGGLWAYTSQDGSVKIVDKDGYTVNSPPHYLVDGLQGTVYTQAQDGSAIEIPAFKPSLDGVYAYTAQDGSVSLVDAFGFQIDCPPHFDVEALKGDVYTKDTEGSDIKMTAYKPSLEGMYLYTAQDGSISVVDKNGVPVQSPPHINKVHDASGQLHYYVKYPGFLDASPPTELKHYLPGSSDQSIKGMGASEINLPPQKTNKLGEE